MSFQPILNHSLTSIEAARFLLSHSSGQVNIDAPSADNTHIHSYYEIYVNISGNVSFLVRNNIYPIQPGDVIITAPGDIHHCIYHSSCLHDHYCLWFDVPRTSCVAKFLEEHDLFGLVRTNSACHDELIALLCKLHEDTSSDLEKLTAFLHLFQLLKDNRDAFSFPATNIPEILRDILNYIDQTFAEILQINEIAEHFHISISTLNRLFKKYVQLSPYAYLKNKKLAFAEKLLVKGCSVTEACYQTGFTDCSRFIKFFKERYGTTPLQYVKHHRQ